MTTDEAIEAIREILERHIPGTWANGRRMETFLRSEADKMDDDIQDDMSARKD